MKVALVLDNPRRDLNGVLLTAYRLLRLGVESYVVPMYVQGYDIPLLGPDAVIVNYARTTNRELLQTYRALGILVLVMDTEGGIFSESGSDSPENWAKFFLMQASTDAWTIIFFGDHV